MTDTATPAPTPAPTAPPLDPAAAAAMDAAGLPDPMGDMIGLTLEEAHSEALELIGEQQVTIRVLSKRLRVAMQMLHHPTPLPTPLAAPPAPPAPPAPNRGQRRANGRANGKAKQT